MAPRIPNLGTARRVATFKPRRLHLRVKSSCDSPSGRLGGPQCGLGVVKTEMSCSAVQPIVRLLYCLLLVQETATLACPVSNYLQVEARNRTTRYQEQQNHSTLLSTGTPENEIRSVSHPPVGEPRVTRMQKRSVCRPTLQNGLGPVPLCHQLTSANNIKLYVPSEGMASNTTYLARLFARPWHT